MEARAQKKYIRSTPRKMRMVIDMIRGKSAEEAMSILHFSKKRAAKYAENLLKSALSNLSNKDDGRSIDNSSVMVSEVYCDGGPVIKRIQPAPMGRAYRIRKRTNHLTIVVSTQE